MTSIDHQLELQLHPLRERIDELDSRLLELLNERAKIALDVGEIKAKLSAPVFRPERERQVIARLQIQNSGGPLQADHIASIWHQIMSACRSLEQE